jgi:hypothetical protein
MILLYQSNPLPWWGSLTVVAGASPLFKTGCSYEKKTRKHYQALSWDKFAWCSATRTFRSDYQNLRIYLPIFWIVVPVHDSLLRIRVRRQVPRENFPLSHCLNPKGRRRLICQVNKLLAWPWPIIIRGFQSRWRSRLFLIFFCLSCNGLPLGFTQSASL